MQPSCSPKFWLLIRRTKVVLLLSHQNGEKGILLANKLPFSEEEKAIERLCSAKRQEISRNDIFGSYQIEVDSDLKFLKGQLIYPANSQLIAKYRQEEKFIISETPHIYETVTKQYIEKFQLNLNVVCIYCLEKRSEVDKIVYEDPDKNNGFLIMQDIKWDGKTIENLYLLSIVYQHALKSVRNLTGFHLPMLKSIKEKSLTAVNNRYGLRPDQVKCYFHYQPSYYNLTTLKPIFRSIDWFLINYERTVSRCERKLQNVNSMLHVHMNKYHGQLSFLTGTRDAQGLRASDLAHFAFFDSRILETKKP